VGFVAHSGYTPRFSFSTPYDGTSVSFDKLYKRIQERAFLILCCLRQLRQCAIRFLAEAIPKVLSSCIKTRQPSRKTSLQRLEQLHHGYPANKKKAA
jgi:hypothetical protein